MKVIVGGVTSDLGVTEATPTISILDYSRRETDEFGVTTVVERGFSRRMFGAPVIVPRAWAKRMSVNALIRTDMIDAVANRIAAVRARPVIWTADSEYDSLQVEGFFKEFSIERGETVSRLSLSIEGLSQAADLPTFDDVFKGIQTDRYPTEAPTDPKIGSIYFDGNLKPYRFEGRYIFNGESQLLNGSTPLYGSGWVSVRDKGLTEIVDDLQALDDDGKLTVIEKKIAIERDRQLENIYNGVIQQANALGYDASAVISARLDYITIRNSIVPAWNDTTQPSDFSNTGWDLVLDIYEAAIFKAQADMAAIASITVIPPEAQVVRTDFAGDPVSGELPRTLTIKVKQADVDITTSDDVSYTITTTPGITASLPAKGQISVTDATAGKIDLTVSVGSVELGPFPIAFTKQYAQAWEGNETAGKKVFEDGWTKVWKQVSIPPNATTYIPFGHTFSQFAAEVSISGGEVDTNAQDNNPEVIQGQGTAADRLAGAYVFSARDNAIVCKLSAEGV